MLTTDFVPGAPNWLDLGTPDTDAAVAFYGSVFGWEFQSAGPDAGGYGFLNLDGKMIAGIGPLTEEGASSAWTLYFHTPDADAVAKAVEQAGGTVRVPPGDVFTEGRMAQFTDPTGGKFGVWQPRDTSGVQIVNAPNALFWIELYTTDAAAAKDFYARVLSWKLQEMPMGEGITYTIITPADGKQDSEQGGIMQLQQDNLDAGSTSEWHPYFAVSDCDATFAKATESGGTALIPPVDAEGIGRLAMLLDPFGAPFAVITPPCPEVG